MGAVHRCRVVPDRVHRDPRPDDEFVSVVAYAIHGLSLDNAELITAQHLVLDRAVQLRHSLAGDDQRILMGSVASPVSEAVEQFACFGGTCSVLVQGTGPGGSAAEAVAQVKRRLLEWHVQFSRFEPSSELSLLNRDPRESVRVSTMMTRLVEAALHAARMTGGLVDPTLVGEIERAGYANDFTATPIPLDEALRLGLPRQAASPHPAARWREVSVDHRNRIVTRPVGVRLDSGGIAKGLFGDRLAAALAWHESFAVAAAGDVRFGGAAGLIRPVRVTSPFDERRVLHTFELVRGAAATSAIGKRSWLREDGQPAHHLLNPATGESAFTGVVQATALAPTGAEAEALAKAALLSGADQAAGWLPHGGLVVYDGGGFELIEPPGGKEAQ